MFRNVLAILFAIWCPAVVAAQSVTLQTEGASDDLRSLVNDASLVRAIRRDSGAVPQDYIAAARADYRRLLTALYEAGHYGGTVSILIDGVEAAAIDPLLAPQEIEKVEIIVTPGPQFTFGTLNIAPLPPETTLPEDFAPGEPAQSGVVQEGVAAAITAWRQAGYAQAAATSQQITADHNQNQLNVAVVITPGPQVTFGGLTVTGNRNVTTERVAEIAGLPTGTVYSPEELDKAQSRLRRTGTFDSVTITEAEQINPDGTLDVTVQVNETKRRRFGFGLEQSSIEGLTVSSFWLHRNLLGGAERLRVDAEVSGIDGETGGTDYKVGTSFNRPATFGPDTDFFALGEVAREDEPDYLIDKLSLEVGLSRVIDDEFTIEVGFGLLTAREESDLGNREYTLLTMPLKATLDRRDRRTDAEEGYYAALSMTPFVGLQGGTDGARFFADARTYHSFGNNNWLTIALRSQVGSVSTAKKREAPADFLFYSGGGGTVRGQPYKSLGIDTIVGADVISTGGTSFVGGQIETRFNITESIGVVGFYDIGHVGDTSVPFEGGDWHAGAGIGLRYDTGIGPIRLDLGTPASGPNVGENLQVYIGIGQAF